VFEVEVVVEELPEQKSEDLEDDPPIDESTIIQNMLQPLPLQFHQVSVGALLYNTRIQWMKQ
jgi:hypothetical protein